MAAYKARKVQLKFRIISLVFLLGVAKHDHPLKKVLTRLTNGKSF